MTILFAASEMDGFSPADGDCFESGGSSRVNGAFARAGIYLSGSTTFAKSASWGNTTDIWIHFDFNIDTWNGNNAEYSLIRCYDAAGQETYRITGDKSGSNYDIRQYYWDGLAFVQMGTSFEVGQDSTHTFDAHIDFSASGFAKIYSSGTERLDSGVVDLSGLGGIDHLYLKGSLRTYFSQIIVATESTIGKRLMTIVPSGAGAATAWVGDYSRVDEVLYSDADFINSGTAAQEELFTHSTTIPDGYVASDVIVSARTKRGSSGPANLRLLVRSSGTTYDNGSDIALDVGYEPKQAVFAQDPATTADWLNSAITALQFGARSVT